MIFSFTWSKHLTSLRVHPIARLQYFRTDSIRGYKMSPPNILQWLLKVNNRVVNFRRSKSYKQIIDSQSDIASQQIDSLREKNNEVHDLNLAKFFWPESSVIIPHYCLRV